MTARIVVVLPMPLRPISVTTSPAPTVKLTSNSTWAGPYPACKCATESRPVIRSFHLVAEIGRRHLRVGAHLLRRAARKHAAVDQHGDAVGEREHGGHVVLDQHHGKASLQSAQQADEARGLFAAGARHRLVE